MLKCYTYNKNNYLHTLIWIIFMSYSTNNGNSIQIKPIEVQHIDAARTIIINACLELQILPCDSMESLQKSLVETKALADLDTWNNVKELYFDHQGTFLVMLCDDKVIGMGAVKRVDVTTCELKRMFFDPHYRGQGLGSHMLEALISFARHQGYARMRLDVYNPTTSVRAVNLYTKFGFYEISPYKDDPLAKLFMAKDLID